MQENRNEITLDSKPIIDLEKRKESRMNQRNLHDTPKRRKNKPSIREYTDWGHGKTFTEKPIQIERDQYRITQIRKFIQTERKKE